MLLKMMNAIEVAIFFSGMQGASIGGMSHQLQRQLVDGHWVLAFRDAASAQQAAQSVSEHSSRLRLLYAEQLASLLRTL